MKPFKEFTIQFVGLKQGKHNFEYEIGKSFFDVYEYDEFNDVNIQLELVLNKKTTLLELHFKATGSVNINCDVTNEPFDQHINNAFDLVIKFGETFNNDAEDILIISHSEYEINIAQYIYELIVLSVPTKRVHPGVIDGTLDSDILKKLEELQPKEEKDKKNNKDTDPRWDTLKKLLTDK